MASTGYDWGEWTELLSDSPSENPDPFIVLTQGETTQDMSEIVDLDIKAACEVSIIATYSNDAQAAGTGLYVFLLRAVNNGDFENFDDGAFSFLMEFTQAGTRRKTISVSPADMGTYKLGFNWDNSTAGAAVTIQSYVRTADIPAAS